MTGSSPWPPGARFTNAERAALALTEAATREEAARHYDESELAALVVSIASINAWNRMNVIVEQCVSG